MHIARIAALAVLIAASSAWGAARPEPGRYSAEIAITEVHGDECNNRPGAHQRGVVLYRGFEARRVTIRIPIAFDGFSGFDVQELTITSGAGTLRPRGSFSERITAPLHRRITGSFEAELTLEDAEAFNMRLTEMAPTIGCTVVLQIALARSG
jgi:hypothetical protein